jgi:3-oxoacyl-[acyl-carrier-protein] synthase III
VTVASPARRRLAAGRAPAGAAVAGVGMAVPDAVVASGQTAERLGLAPGWIESRTGVHERRVAAPGDRLSDLAAEAGRHALADAGVEAADLDLVLVATVTADEVMPNAAPVVAGALGAERAGALDVGAACTGFLGAFAMGAAWLETGRARNALVIGADLFSRVVDPDDRATAPLFGDGAGACLLTAVPAPGRVGPVIVRADAEAAPLVVAKRGGWMRMEGPETYRLAVARLVEVTTEACEAAGLAPTEVDLLVYHQANARILRAVGQRLGLDPERVVESIGRYGNTSAGSVPIALAEAHAEDRLHDGAKVLLGAFGAGMTWGAAVVEWGR